MSAAATALRALHVAGDPLVLPNAWDADTARLVVAAGFPAVATSSGAVAAALGFEDHQGAPAGEMFAAAARIAAAVDVPVTVDAEAGYGLDPGRLAEALLTAGAAGCNLEDSDHRTGALRPIAEQAAYLAAVRAAAGDALVINARVDAFFAAADEAAAFPDALARARAYLDAGADCVYPILLCSPDLAARFIAALGAPVNLLIHPRTFDLEAARNAGAARVSLGVALWRAQQAWFTAALADVAAGRLPT